MKNSLKIIFFFVLGILAGLFSLLPDILLDNDFTVVILYFLIFFVGFNVGIDSKAFSAIKEVGLKIVLVPITVVFGTLSGVFLLYLISPFLPLKDMLAVSSGFGYYSLSSVLITQMRNETLGVLALAINVSREIFTLIFTPLMARYLGKTVPIISGGATSMDTTLPIITRYSGKEYAFIAVFNGFVLSVLVPIIIAIILKI